MTMTMTTAGATIVACSLINLVLMLWGPRRAKRPGEYRREPAPYKAWVTACMMIALIVATVTSVWCLLSVFGKLP